MVAASLTIAAVAAGPALTAAPSLAAGSLPTLTIAISPKTVTVGGSQVEGAVKIVTTVTGEKSDEPALLLLRPGITPADSDKAVSAFHSSTPGDAIDPYASIVFDEPASEGTPASGETWLRPGTYVAAGNGSAETTFTVAPSAAPALLPAPPRPST